MSFTELVEEIQTLPLDEKVEIHSLMEKYIIEARRDKFYNDYLDAERMIVSGELNFSSDTDELMKMLQ